MGVQLTLFQPGQGKYLDYTQHITDCPPEFDAGALLYRSESFFVEVCIWKKWLVTYDRFIEIQAPEKKLYIL